MRLATLFCLIGILAIYQTQAQSEHTLLREGDGNYRLKDYKMAEENYRKALQQKESAKGAYNLGNAIYQQEDRMKEAITAFENAANAGKNNKLRAKAYHNLGNAHYKNGDYKSSVEAYKNALRLDPSDFETKYNLSQAQRRLRLQEQQQQQQQQQQETKEEQEQEEQQQQQQQMQNQSSQQAADRQKKEEYNTKELTKQDAENMLKVVEQEEQQVMEKLKRKGAEKSKVRKDW